MDIDLNFHSHIPIYVQIIDQIKRKIATGELKPGDQLPTVRQLAADLRVNFNTIARAYRLLDEDRIISTQHGRGTFITQLPSEENGEELRKQSLVRLTAYYLSEAHRLGFSTAEVNQTYLDKLAIWNETGAPLPPDEEG